MRFMAAMGSEKRMMQAGAILEDWENLDHENGTLARARVGRQLGEHDIPPLLYMFQIEGIF